MKAVRKRSIGSAYREYRTIISELVQPNLVVDHVEDIALEKLRDANFHTVFLDLDNTILTYGNRLVQLREAQWVEKVKSYGFRVVILTNNRNYRRVKRACDQLEVPGIYFAMKPLVFTLRDYAQQEGISLENSVVIGDQVLTDVIMGNWLRCHTVLVDPLDKKLSFIKTWQRDFELNLLKRLR